MSRIVTKTSTQNKKKKKIDPDDDIRVDFPFRVVVGFNHLLPNIFLIFSISRSQISVVEFRCAGHLKRSPDSRSTESNGKLIPLAVIQFHSSPFLDEKLHVARPISPSIFSHEKVNLILDLEATFPFNRMNRSWINISSPSVFACYPSISRPSGSASNSSLELHLRCFV